MWLSTGVHLKYVTLQDIYVTLQDIYIYPVANSASCTIGTVSFLGVKSGRGVKLTPHPFLVLWSWKTRARPLHPYGPYGLYRVSVPVQGWPLPFTFLVQAVCWYCIFSSTGFHTDCVQLSPIGYAKPIYFLVHSIPIGFFFHFLYIFN